MFELEQAIAEWRQEAVEAGLAAPEVLDEMESHLREDIEEQMRCGTAVDEAWRAAVDRIGEAGALQKEFQKINEMKSRSKSKHVRLAVAFAGNQLNNMTALNSAIALESRWATYTKAAAFVAPALCLWAFSTEFLFPRVQTICRDSGLAVPTFFRVVMAIMGLLKDHGAICFGVLLLSLVLLEWRSGGWPGYRRMSVGVVVFIVNSAVLVLITAMFTLAMMTAPALFQTR